MTRGREHTLYHQWRFGTPPPAADATPVMALTSDPLPIFHEKHASANTPKPRCRRWLAWGWWLAVSVLVVYQVIVWSHVENPASIATATPKLLASDDHGDGASDYFSVQYPFIKDNWQLVDSATVIKHTFNHSFGHPAEGQWHPPQDDVAYNRAVLELDVTVDGVQYDRLVNVFIGDVQVWRSSTIEPGGKQVHSTAVKDITRYLSLLRHDQPITVQLDNVVDKNLTGAFATKLTVQLYQVDDTNGIDRDLGQQLFATHGAASRVYPLKVDSQARLPVRLLPQQPFELPLPSVDHNTTSLQLEIFASGNADEEDWYSNVLDRFRKVVKGSFGHGPARFIRVRVGDDIVADIAPPPVIFTGAVSPALWRPVVSSTAFIVPSTSVDLTPWLPLLWHHATTDGTPDVKIEVVNGEGKSVGNNWITTANVLAYQHADVTAAKGTFGGVHHKTDHHQHGHQPGKGAYTQKVNVTKKSRSSAYLEFTLNDADPLKLNYTSVTKAEVVNVQRYQHGFRNQRILHVTDTVDRVHAESVGDGDVEYSLAVKGRDVLHLRYRYLTPDDDDETKFKVALSTTRQLSVDARKMSHEVSEVQTGASEFVVSPRGNHGRGSLDTNLQVTSKIDGTKHKYARVVSVVDGKVRLDIEG
ncbi:hypothetical protein DIURU_004039 [Diutina rugosa]|uniref:Peptide N-acetyl-beta-D-glucosaminyl asparaginase amidase A N-terminal domain-containing protein n=1 Tax=Diutina rugosa TaxID=5481 RepID=A0A642UIL1_DIURU|nr:uncharacterized protein DIURU_004039 [Diutina rugosa]KAA8899782.1 hypothetical protein DIURU_004039 [Diutina rugosa]